MDSAEALSRFAAICSRRARVDGVVKDGQFLLMELEAFEPLMFLAGHPEAPGRFARAVQGRVLAR